MAAGRVKATISIVLRGKEVYFTSFPHVVDTLNSMSFLLLLFFVPAYSKSMKLFVLAAANHLATRLATIDPTITYTLIEALYSILFLLCNSHNHHSVSEAK